MSNYRHTPRTHLGPFSSQLYLRTISPASKADGEASGSKALEITSDLLTVERGEPSGEMDSDKSNMNSPGADGSVASFFVGNVDETSQSHDMKERKEDMRSELMELHVLNLMLDLSGREDQEEGEQKEDHEEHTKEEYHEERDKTEKKDKSASDRGTRLDFEFEETDNVTELPSDYQVEEIEPEPNVSIDLNTTNEFSASVLPQGTAISPSQEATSRESRDHLIHENLEPLPVEANNPCQNEIIPLDKNESSPMAQSSAVANLPATDERDIANGVRPGGKKFAGLAKNVRLLNRLKKPKELPKKEGMNNLGAIQAQTEFLTKFGMGLPHLHAHSAPNSGIKWEGSKIKFIKNKLVFDSNADYYFHWLIVVSVAILYNLFLGEAPYTVINVALLICDVIADGVYLIDIFVKSRTGFMEQGILVRDVKKTTKIYVKNWQFRLDMLSIIPLDYLYEILRLDSHPYFRFVRLLQVPRLWGFISKAETRQVQNENNKILEFRLQMLSELVV